MDKLGFLVKEWFYCTNGWKRTMWYRGSPYPRNLRGVIHVLRDTNRALMFAIWDMAGRPDKRRDWEHGGAPEDDGGAWGRNK